jgi:hypothetical protein
MKIKMILFVLVLLTCIGAMQAQVVSKVGTSAAPFLAIEVGGRALAMGGAFVATSNDATALYWNPAGLPKLQKAMVTLSHTQWIADIAFDYAGVTIPLSSADAIGLSVTSLNMDDMMVRTVFYPEGTGEYFGSSDLALSGSYGRSLTDRFSIGFTGKFVQQKLWHMSASAFAMDVGVLFTTQLHDMRIGMSISNFGGKMHLEGIDTQVTHDISSTKAGNNDKIIAHLQTDRWSMPLVFRVGAALDVVNRAQHRLTCEVDAVHPSDNAEYVNLGAEYAFNNNIFLRGGYKSLFLDDSEEGLTLGAGLAYNMLSTVSLRIDYAYLDFGILNAVHRFSLGFDF